MSRYIKIPEQFFIRNRKKLYDRIPYPAIFLFFSAEKKIRNGDQYYKYRQNSDLFYFSGIEQEDTVLVFCPLHPNTEFHENVFVSSPDEKNKVWYGDGLSHSEIREISGINNIRQLTELESFLRELIGFTSNIYFQHDITGDAADLTEFTRHTIAGKIFNTFCYGRFNNLKTILAELRSVKEPEEIELIRRAVQITKGAYHKALLHIAPGKYEYEVEAAITAEFIAAGATDHAFQPIIASGQNACTLHYNKNTSRMKDSELVLLDFGAEYGNYAADCSRTIPVNGCFSARQKVVYDAVLAVSRQMKEYFIPGNTIMKLNEIAGKLMQDELLRIGLIRREEIKAQTIDNPAYTKYFMHGVSHFLGLDVHDVGNKTDVLTKGMILTCEPGIYIAEEGLGVRIENDILIDDNPVNLMDTIPSITDEIEDLMQLNKT